MIVVVVKGRVTNVTEGFFFQAEDGIRDYKVTGVQTCALPILYPFLIREPLERSALKHKNIGTTHF